MDWTCVQLIYTTTTTATTTLYSRSVIGAVLHYNYRL